MSRKALQSILANNDNPSNINKGTEANASSPEFEGDSSDSTVSMEASDDDEDEDQNDSQVEWPSIPNYRYLFESNLFKNKIYINLSKVVKDNNNILKSNINLNKIDLQNNFSLINKSNSISSCKYCTKHI